MPEVRPFRALRYDAESVGDLAAVVAPPYDVIGAEEAARLLARHPKNVVRLDLPSVAAGDEPDERYRRAARTLAAWRSDGTFHKDPRAAIYVYEQTYRVPGTDTERTQRGFFGRLRLESFDPGSGVLPHERTLEGPREDRYRLLRATGVNTSPVVGLYEDASGTSAAILATIAAGPAAIDLRDADDVRHRLWIAEAEGDAGEHVAELLALAGAGPVTIADGHHRYETALRYRDERRMSRSCEEDPAFDYLLMLFLETTSEPLTVLPTHRLIRGLGPDGLVRLGEPLARAVRIAAGRDRRAGAHVRQWPGERRSWALRALDAGRWVDPHRPPPCNLRGFGRGAPRRQAARRMAAWRRPRAPARDRRCRRRGRRTDRLHEIGQSMPSPPLAIDEADAAFLLEPTPVPSITAVARSGEVMPQKSTYFFPKALTGLVINPHEW